MFILSMKKRYTLTDFSLSGRRVLLRTDYNVPLEKKGKHLRVADNTKIVASLKTISYLLQKNCKIVILTHIGRPTGRVVKELSVAPVKKELERLLRMKITLLQLTKNIQQNIQNAKERVILLENLRFYPGEEQNDHSFAEQLAQLGDYYLNDAFGVSHRESASTVAITNYLPSASGFLLEEELQKLSLALHPQRPSVWVIGGAKLDKVGLFHQALKKADHILVGGALAFSFLRAKGFFVGMSKTDTQSVRLAKEILRQKGSKKIVLPVDVVIGNMFSFNTKKQTVPIAHIPSDGIGLDLGPLTVKIYQKYIQDAETIVWNGPFGVYEWPRFAQGTKKIAQYIASRRAVTIVGGGETTAVVKKYRLEKKFTHLSTGGGASLEFLAGKRLPAVEALEKSYQVFKKKRW